MKKLILGVLTAMTIIYNGSAAEHKLPTPERGGGMPLMQALNERRSVKRPDLKRDSVGGIRRQPQRRIADNSDRDESKRSGCFCGENRRRLAF